MSLTKTRLKCFGLSVNSLHDVVWIFSLIGVARVVAVGARPPGRGKIFRRNLQEKFVSAPEAEQESNFRIFLLGGGNVDGRSGLFSSFIKRFKGDD